MQLFLASLAIFLCAAIIMGIFAIWDAVSPHGRVINRLANILGATFASLGCLAGFAGAVKGSWNIFAEPETAVLPWGLPFGQPELVLDPLGRIFLLPVFVLGFACAICGKLALKHEKITEHNFASHWFFYILLLAGMSLVLTAHDAVLFITAWEIMSLAPFFLIDFNDNDSKVRNAAWVYLTAAHLGAVLLIAFFVLLWQITGQTMLDPSITAKAASKAGMSSTLFLLALFGFGAKAGITPLHVWLPEAHPAAPSHVSALLSGAMINTGVYGVLRTITLLCGLPDFSADGIIANPGWWGWLLLVIGLLTAFTGILKALGQGNLKRLLAYSSVENIGLMFVAAGSGLIGQNCGNAWIAVAGFAGCLIHMLNHAGFKGLLFLCAGEVLHSSGTLQLDLLGGLQKKMPYAGILFAIGAASIACLPPFSGFISEFVICIGLANGATLPGVEKQLGLLFSFGLVGLISGLACALYAKAYGIAFLGNPRSKLAENASPVHFSALWPLLVPALACIAGGLFAPAFLKAAASAAFEAAPMPGELLQASLKVVSYLNASISYISLFGWVVCMAVIAMWLIRKFMLRTKFLPERSTWGCGYQASSVRIQYTASSFSEPLTKIFGPLSGIRKNENTGRGILPQKGSFALISRDLIINRLYAPVFELLERLCNACKIIQHGKIHLYILYIIVTVIGLLFWGLWS